MDNVQLISKILIGLALGIVLCGCLVLMWLAYIMEKEIAKSLSNFFIISPELAEINYKSVQDFLINLSVYKTSK